jgi:hypothetical protein
MALLAASRSWKESLKPNIYVSPAASNFSKLIEYMP